MDDGEMYGIRLYLRSLFEKASEPDAPGAKGI